MEDHTSVINKLGATKDYSGQKFYFQNLKKTYKRFPIYVRLSRQETGVVLRLCNWATFCFKMLGISWLQTFLQYNGSIFKAQIMTEKRLR